MAIKIFPCDKCRHDGPNCIPVNVGGHCTKFKAKHKYGAERTELDGIKFDSKKEAAKYAALKMLKKSGAITDFERQVPFELVPGFVKDGKKYRAMKIIIDFVVYWPDGRVQYIDTKGLMTEAWTLKWKLWHYQNPDKELVIE